ncbi:hypothetical protein KSF_095860 [Reticulibacter mediterranei]|uniref:Uncharacterized protein n=2 Tax=Reticulibacter mediterranei TaxID=2778369 RepID=A0A8J3IVY1_9CHLR|nr:hypothetical protein KSF_095860 [Reticulibacter mediterranei]
MQEEWDRIEEPISGGQSNSATLRLMRGLEESIQERSDETCAHPRLFGLPGGSGNSYTLVCESCTKRLVIGYGAFIGDGNTKEFCLAAMVKETFGDAWGLKAELQCRCSACKARRYEV